MTAGCVRQCVCVCMTAGCVRQCVCVCMTAGCVRQCVCVEALMHAHARNFVQEKTIFI